jgi:hypothetical protein
MRNPYDVLFYSFYATTSEKDPFGRSRQARAMLKLLILLIMNAGSITYIISPALSIYFAFPIVEVSKILITSLSCLAFGYGFWKVIFADNYKKIISNIRSTQKSDGWTYSDLKVFYIMATVILFGFSGIILASYFKK